MYSYWLYLDSTFVQYRQFLFINLCTVTGIICTVTSVQLPAVS